VMVFWCMSCWKEKSFAHQSLLYVYSSRCACWF
jgi:hypothetical protein